MTAESATKHSILKKRYVLFIIAIAIGAMIPDGIKFVWRGIFTTRPRRETYIDVKDLKEIGLLSVQRVQFSRGVLGLPPGVTPKSPIRDNDLYVRRIIRGHATTSLDLAKVTVTDTGKTVVLHMPVLEKPEPIIDEWVYYDSKGTAKVSPNELTKEMDHQFKEALVEFASDPDRQDRARKQAETLIAQLFPKKEITFDWPTTNKTTQTD